MGGSALTVSSCRLNKEEYEDVAKKLGDSFLWGEVIKSYEDKSSFGDLDFLYPIGWGYEDSGYVATRLMESGFHLPVPFVKNSDITSYGISTHKGVFQVDFVGVPEESFSFAYNYFAYNDLGNLLGRVARRIGLKLGHNGLWFIQYAPENDTVKLAEHLLTADWDEAIEHLGYEVERYHKGFKSLPDIFDFVMSSRFYDFNKFDLTQRNYKARVRDAKRPNYRAFLEYANAHPCEYKIDTVEHYRTYSFGRFPKLYEDYFDVLDKHQEHLKFKLKYNGKIVSSITGLKGKELGKFMTSLDLGNSKHWVIGATQKQIEEYVMARFLEDWKNVDARGN